MQMSALREQYFNKRRSLKELKADEVPLPNPIMASRNNLTRLARVNAQVGPRNTMNGQPPSGPLNTNPSRRGLRSSAGGLSLVGDRFMRAPIDSSPESIEDSSIESLPNITPNTSPRKMDTAVGEYRVRGSGSSSRRPRRSGRLRNPSGQVSPGSARYNGVNERRSNKAGNPYPYGTTGDTELQVISTLDANYSPDELASNPDSPPPANITSDLPQPSRKEKVGSGPFRHPGPIQDDMADELGSQQESKPSKPAAKSQQPRLRKGDIPVVLAASGTHLYKDIFLRRDPRNSTEWEAFDARGQPLPNDLCLRKGAFTNVSFNPISQYLFIMRRGTTIAHSMMQRMVLELQDSRDVDILRKSLDDKKTDDSKLWQKDDPDRLRRKVEKHLPFCTIAAPQDDVKILEAVQSTSSPPKSTAQDIPAGEGRRRPPAKDLLQGYAEIKGGQKLGGSVNGSRPTVNHPLTRSRKTQASLFQLPGRELRREQNSVRKSVLSSLEPSPEPLRERWSDKNTSWKENFKRPIVFPPVGRDRATVSQDDIPRLDEEQLLNDSLVQFGLRYAQIEAEQKTPTLATKVYVMNTYFFEALKQDQSHERVRKWNSKIDLLSFDYIVVPVNESLHWYLAIICNPAKLIPGRQRDEPVVVLEPDGRKQQVPGSAKAETNSFFTLRDKISRVNEADGPKKPSSSPQGKGRKGSKKRLAPPGRKHESDEFLIITLDSLGQGHPGTIKRLKLYIIDEIESRLSVEPERPSPIGITAKGIPEQPNFSDCGLYLIEYFKSFLNDPAGVIETLVRRENTGWLFDPSRMRNELRTTLLNIGQKQSREYQEAKRGKMAQSSSSPPRPSNALLSRIVQSPQGTVRDTAVETGVASQVTAVRSVSSGPGLEAPIGCQSRDIGSSQVSKPTTHCSPAAEPTNGPVNKVSRDDIEMTDAPGMLPAQQTATEDANVAPLHNVSRENSVTPSLSFSRRQSSNEAPKGILPSVEVEDDMDDVDLIPNHAAPESDDQKAHSGTFSPPVLPGLRKQEKDWPVKGEAKSDVAITDDIEAGAIGKLAHQHGETKEMSPSSNRGIEMLNRVPRHVGQADAAEDKVEVVRSAYFTGQNQTRKSPAKVVHHQTRHFARPTLSEGPDVAARPLEGMATSSEAPEAKAPAVAVLEEPTLISPLRSSSVEGILDGEARQLKKRPSGNDGLEPGGSKRQKVSPDGGGRPVNREPVVIQDGKYTITKPSGRANGRDTPMANAAPKVELIDLTSDSEEVLQTTEPGLTTKRATQDMAAAPVVDETGMKNRAPAGNTRLERGTEEQRVSVDNNLSS